MTSGVQNKVSLEILCSKTPQASGCIMTWSILKGGKHKASILICAFTQDNPYWIGMWWTKGNKVYNVSGIARGKTKNLRLTFDVDPSETLDVCKRNR